MDDQKLPDNFYKLSKDYILDRIAAIYPPIKFYFPPTRWDETDSGSFPVFKCPSHIAQELAEALRKKT
jgi:hypothetical protein